MGKIAGARALQGSLAGVRRDMDAAFKPVVEQVSGIVLSSARSDGSLDPAQIEGLSERIGDLVQRLFTQGRKAYNGVRPLAAVPEVLNKWYAYVTYSAVDAHYVWLRRNTPDDVFAALADASRLFPIGEAESMPHDVRDRLRIFEPNPLAELDPSRQWVPMHRWTDERGYQLSDRVWQAGVSTRLKIDRVIADGIRQGLSAVELAKRLEQYLLPSRKSVRTKKPYGTNLSYDAMRIARTEIARAANQAAFISAYMNPYVQQVEVVRSGTGDPTCTVCPMHATIGIGGERLRPPYDIRAASIPVYHPHCKCRIEPVVGSEQSVTTDLRRYLGDAPVTINPASRDSFARHLLGNYLFQLIDLG